ncbi:MAG: hypothetical protein DRR42_21110 [Gammaproteobacteria bacterium]|nr:MAG: hypothetical protein DRR42_21110 [Gammaproteobacteria bacterium]
MTKPAYKLAHIDKAEIALAARKGLMVADSHYFAWPAKQQERFRATMSEKARQKVECVLIDCLLGIKCSAQELPNTWDDIPLPKLNIINWANLLTQGIGEDYICLNEHMAEGKSLLDFSTLYDYDYDNYLFQEEAKKQDFSGYKGVDYFAYQYTSWVRLLIQEQFYYASFMSLATHFLDEIESAGSDHIRQLIPHDYVDGNDQGKPEKGGFLWDMKVDAGGLEAQLEELQSRWYVYQQERWVALSRSISDLPSAVFIQDPDWDDDPHRLFIFNNVTTLKLIRWQHFLSDCKPLITDFSLMEEQLKKEIGDAISWLSENHKDILKNFDPKITKLRKKTKIIMSSRAMEDLANIDSDDEPYQ